VSRESAALTLGQLGFLQLGHAAVPAGIERRLSEGCPSMRPGQNPSYRKTKSNYMDGAIQPSWQTSIQPNDA
jgi:hypothetical protein